MKLASLSPSFSPTPNKSQPPDGNILHAELMEFKRVLSWKAHFRYKDFEASSSFEDFVNMELPTFKSPLGMSRVQKYLLLYQI